LLAKVEDTAESKKELEFGFNIAEILKSLTQKLNILLFAVEI